MSERISDKDLHDWNRASAVMGNAMWPSSTVYPMSSELLALRAHVAQLEDDLEAARRCARLAQDAHDIVRARVAKLETALQGLVDRLDEIHDDPAYKSVWTSYMIHGGRYAGPTYVEALDRARAALKYEP